MGANVRSDGCLKVGDGFENAVSDGPLGQDREEILDSVELRSGCWGEMVSPTRIVRQPFQNLRMLARGVVVDHGVDHLSDRNGALDGVEELDQLLMAVVRHAAPDDRAVKHVERGEQGCRAVALIVLRHGPAFAWLQREAGLGALKSLDLALLVDRDDDRVVRRVHAEANNVLDLGGEGRIVRPLECAQAMGAPDALNGTQRNPAGLRHSPSGPMGDGAGGLGAAQRDDPRDNGLLAIGAVPGLRVLSRSKPSTPSSAMRRRQRQTARRLTPAWRATSNTGNRSSESNTIFARCTRLRGVVAIADYPLGAFDVEALGGTQTVWAIRQARTSDRICESYVWLSALGRI